MKIDFDQPLIGLGGVPLTEKASIDTSATPVLLHHVCIGALTANTPEAQPTGSGEKAKRFAFANGIARGGVQEISVGDVALLQRLIEAAYPMQIVGPAWNALEAETSEAVASA